MFRSCQIIIKELCYLLSYITVLTIQFVFANEVLWQHIILRFGAVARCASYTLHT